MTRNDSQAAGAKSTRGSNQSGMRAHNERLVLTLIRHHGPLAKAEIARITGLSAQAVSVIMRSLEADGLLQKGEPVRGKVGQPSVPMSLCADGAYFLGLKVGRRSLDLIMTDFLGREKARLHHIQRVPTPDGAVEFAHAGIARLLAQLPADARGRVAGLGIAIPFRLWDWAQALGVAQEEMDAWRGRDIAAEIGAGWDFPVFLQNDASAACGAELVFGARDHLSEFLYFFVGFFIGGGLVIDRRLHTGPTGNAAALGSMPVLGPDNRVRELIDLASLATLEAAIIQAGGDGAGIWENAEVWDVDAAVLDRWLDDAAYALAFATRTAATLLDLGHVLIDGWMPAAVRQDLTRRTAIALRGMPAAGIDLPEVGEGSIGPDARALGAASLPLSERFLVDRDAFLKA